MKRERVTAEQIKDVVRRRIARDNRRVSLYHWVIASLTKFIGKPINNRTVRYLEKLLADPKTAPNNSKLNLRLEFSGVGVFSTARLRFYGELEGRRYQHDYGFVYDLVRDKDGNYNEALTIKENDGWIARVSEDYRINRGILDDELAQSLANRYNETARMIQAWKAIVGDTSLNYALNFNVENELESTLKYREYGEAI